MGKYRVLDVFPTFAMNNKLNISFRYAESFCENSKRGIPILVQVPNFRNLGCNQFRRSGSFSDWRIKPSLVAAITHVISMTSWKQVLGIYTGWIITCMAYLDMVRNWTIGHLPRNSMRPLFSARRRLATRNRNKSAISMLMPVPAPYPALSDIVFKYFAPKSFINIRHLESVAESR